MNDVSIASYTDDNTIYDSRGSIDGVIASLQISVKKCFQCFSANQMEGDSELTFDIYLKDIDKRKNYHCPD